MDRPVFGGNSRTLVGEFSDIASGNGDNRPGFQAADVRCRRLGAVLVAARLDRITRRRASCRSCWRTVIRSVPLTCWERTIL
jgi:DNA invertase Pin-like site-specific DNA recombinase